MIYMYLLCEKLSYNKLVAIFEYIPSTTVMITSCEGCYFSIFLFLTRWKSSEICIYLCTQTCVSTHLFTLSKDHSSSLLSLYHSSVFCLPLQWWKVVKYVSTCVSKYMYSHVSENLCINLFTLTDVTYITYIRIYFYKIVYIV